MGVKNPQPRLLRPIRRRDDLEHFCAAIPRMGRWLPLCRKPVSSGFPEHAPGERGRSRGAAARYGIAGPVVHRWRIGEGQGKRLSRSSVAKFARDSTITRRSSCLPGKATFYSPKDGNRKETGARLPGGTESETAGIPASLRCGEWPVVCTSGDVSRRCRQSKRTLAGAC